MERGNDTERVLIVAPQGRDAELTYRILAASAIVGHVCADLRQLCDAIGEGAACAIVAEESLRVPSATRLIALLADQPPWSDFPLVVVSTRSERYSSSDSEPLRALGNVAILERPVKKRVLVSAVRAALRARRRQYDARRAIEQRDHFLAMLGHELRNPLGAIVMSTEVVRRSGGDAPRLAHQHAIIERQARHLARLVDDLLDVSRVTSGKVVLQRAPLDVNALVARCFEAVRTSAHAQRLELSSQLTPDPIMVDGDAVRLEQIFSNLLANAMKYSPAGSEVRVGTRVTRDLVEVSVRDTGVGIRARMLSRIFDLFAQAETTLDRAQGGMGIGLTLVKSLTELHGGTVEARSAGVGHGSEFVVRLPLAEAKDPAIETRGAVPSPARRVVRVVLVEDNADIRETSRDVLEALGCEVEVAEDGPSGVACIVAARPDLALIDVGLPGIDGYEVGRRVRAELGDAVMLVALTGYGLSEDRHRAETAGFDAHLTKPATVAMLEETIARALERGEPEEKRARGEEGQGATSTC